MILTIRDVEILLLILVLFYGLKQYFNNLQKDRDLSMLTLQLGVKIDKDILNALDDYLEEVFNDYITQHPKYITATYISDDMSTTMRDDLVGMVSTRMSPYLYQQLSLYYNEAVIPDIIANKIMQTLSMFIADRNAVKPS